MAHPQLVSDWRAFTSCHRFSLESLAAAKHDFEMQPDARVHVHLDHRHMGVGGDDSWTPSVHEVRLTWA